MILLISVILSKLPLSDNNDTNGINDINDTTVISNIVKIAN